MSKSVNKATKYSVEPFTFETAKEIMRMTKKATQGRRYAPVGCFDCFRKLGHTTNIDAVLGIQILCDTCTLNRKREGR